MTTTACPRCVEPATNRDDLRYRANIHKDRPMEDNRGVKPFTTDETGFWWICQDCGLVFQPSTGRRNRVVSIWE